MADLTQQDEKNYDDLKSAFLKHNTKKDTDEIISNILGGANISKNPKNTGEMRQKIDALELYLKIIDLLGVELFEVPGIPQNDAHQDEEEKEKLEQEFFNSLKKIKVSLKVVEDENLALAEEIEDKCFDSVILDFLGNGEKTQTKDLLNVKDRPPNLKEKQIRQLIEAWGTAVSKFVEDARSGKDNGKVEPVDPAKPNTQKTLASFFCIHNELEILYGRLADTETVQRIS